MWELFIRGEFTFRFMKKCKSAEEFLFRRCEGTHIPKIQAID